MKEITAISNNFGAGEISFRTLQKDSIVIMTGEVSVNTAHPQYLSAQVLEITVPSLSIISEGDCVMSCSNEALSWTDDYLYIGASLRKFQGNPDGSPWSLPISSIPVYETKLAMLMPVTDSSITRLQGIIAVASFASGVGIAVGCLFVVPPPGEISNSAISIVSELLVLAGAILGVKSSYDTKFRRFEAELENKADKHKEGP